ncbi:hypothetical protein NDU88_008576 [Pleurodeles waltl]|uniref:Uncharacterized protein n=1 Tax=Pleurodeles waltl TaxID=8319 RepID=A0AAV7PX09_PLEWA|nr:hypothetical protein NDU88_008576 [Pleurodeles waltl]
MDLWTQLFQFGGSFQRRGIMHYSTDHHSCNGAEDFQALSSSFYWSSEVYPSDDTVRWSFARSPRGLSFAAAPRRATAAAAPLPNGSAVNKGRGRSDPDRAREPPRFLALYTGALNPNRAATALVEVLRSRSSSPTPFPSPQLTSNLSHRRVPAFGCVEPRAPPLAPLLRRQRQLRRPGNPRQSLPISAGRQLHLAHRSRHLELRAIFGHAALRLRFSCPARTDRLRN